MHFRDAADESRVVASLHKSFVPSGDSCNCFCPPGTETYAVSFPAGADEKERALVRIVAIVFRMHTAVSPSLQILTTVCTIN